MDTLADYDLFAGGTLSDDLDFGAIAAAALTTTIDIALSSFPTDPHLDTNTNTLVSVVLRVSRNNAFSTTVTCAVATATCA